MALPFVEGDANELEELDSAWPEGQTPRQFLAQRHVEVGIMLARIMGWACQ